MLAWKADSKDRSFISFSFDTADVRTPQPDFYKFNYFMDIVYLSFSIFYFYHFCCHCFYYIFNSSIIISDLTILITCT